MNREQRRRAQREGRPVEPPALPHSAQVDDPRFTAALDLVGRTGATSVQIRWSEDEQPVVWFVVALYHLGPDHRPQVGGRLAWEVAAGHSPLEAALRLCERLVDGGSCAHCGRPSGFHEDIDAPTGTVLDVALCWYQWDPELATFRRSCEAEVA